MPPGNNLHRVVIYRDGGEEASQTLPFTATESLDPEDLWQVMTAYEEKTGGKLLAIPHNGNLSKGQMFALVDFDGDQLTRAYVEQRQRWEPIYEVTQIKGDGEAHPLLSPDDEFADYENWDKGKLHEKVYDVVWGDAETGEPGADGRLPPVGNTVDVSSASWTNTIGEPELIAVWEDPDFDPKRRAFYYARVIEIPTPRWTLYDAVRYGVSMPDEAPLTTRERAYTSPIWYTP